MYKDRDLSKLPLWLNDIVKNYDDVYIPIGIHHPDHIRLSNAMMLILGVFNKKQNIYFYVELPYSLRFNDEYRERLDLVLDQFEEVERIDQSLDDRKHDVVSIYKSQVDNEVLQDLLQIETLWKVIK